MAMLAMPESECQEILALFRQHLPNVPDTWLQELAANYGVDAVVDIDPNDVIAIVSMPGKLHRIHVPLAEYEPVEEMKHGIHDEMAQRGIKPAKISGCLMIIHSSSLMLKDICKIVRRYIEVFEIEDKRGWAWYAQEPNRVDSILLWIRFRTNDLS
jgi:hypothetical protein